MEAECTQSDVSHQPLLNREPPQQINTIPVSKYQPSKGKDVDSFKVLFASTACLVLFAMVFFLIGRSSGHCTSVSGVSVLQTLWIAAHSQALYERMADIDDTLPVNMRAAGMSGIYIADVRPERCLPSHRIRQSDSDTLLG
jgi:hypothetical protein